jgi:hypothetical protein
VRDDELELIVLKVTPVAVYPERGLGALDEALRPVRRASNLVERGGEARQVSPNDPK